MKQVQKSQKPLGCEDLRNVTGGSNWWYNLQN
jgi:hypothetical protein